jgi:hypothetical protein
MVADRLYGRGFFESSNGRTSLLYFAAAVPMIAVPSGSPKHLVQNKPIHPDRKFG